MKKLVLLLVLVATSIAASSQCCPYIDSAVLIPENPTADDIVSVVITVTTPNQGAFLNASAEVDIENNFINVEACYYSGLLTALQTYIDTVEVGTVPEGIYQLHFTANQSASPNKCDFSDVNETSNIVMIGEGNSIPELEEIEVAIYPNPSDNGKITFEIDTQVNRIELYALDGKLAAQYSFSMLQELYEIDCPELAAGQYMASIILENNQRLVREVVIE